MLGIIIHKVILLHCLCHSPPSNFSKYSSVQDPDLLRLIHFCTYQISLTVTITNSCFLLCSYGEHDMCLVVAGRVKTLLYPKVSQQLPLEELLIITKSIFRNADIIP